MTMKTLLLSASLAAVFTCSVVAQAGGVAVLDIDQVARDLGVEERVRVDLLTMQNKLNAELQKTQASLQNQMVGVEKAAGENPTEEQRRQIVATNQQLNSEFNRLKGQAQQSLAQERVRLINEFRIQLEPIAMEAAKAKGLDVVLMKVTPPVFTFANEVDITADTTKLALDAGMKVEIPEAPTQATPATPVESGTDSKEKGKE